MARLGEGMKELERLDAERREMISKIDLLSRDQTTRFRLIYIIKLFAHKYVSYSQTAVPNGLIFFEETHGYPRGNIG